MIIAGRVKRWVPPFYAARVASRAKQHAEANPGFHRFVLQVKPAPPMDIGHMVSPDAEPDLRRILARVMVLDPPILDDDPYTQL